MVRTKNTARPASCPVCLTNPGLATIKCTRCLTNFHPSCLVEEIVAPYVCLDCTHSGEYFVRAVIGHRTQNGDRQFRVSWQRGDPTWEPEANLQNSLTLLIEYISENNLEPTTLQEPASSHVGSDNERPSKNWITLHRIKSMVARWTARLPRASLDLPVIILNEERFDPKSDQIVLLKMDLYQV